MATTTLEKEPDDLEEVGNDGISNFDGGSIPSGLEDALRTGKYWAQHCAWDHWGAIWFADGRFHERVMVHFSHVETISAETLSDLIGEVNDRYGHD